MDTLREADGSRQGKKLHLTKGVHLVVPRKRLPVRQAIYFDVPDGRMIFAIPRRFSTYIGTTDTDYDDSIDEVTTTPADARYLLDAVNEAFPSVNLSTADIESSWAGLRPLIHVDGKSASELSRKDEIFESMTGLISIAGGKLTGYRKMAERIVDLVIERGFNDRPANPCVTATKILNGSDFASSSDVRNYIDNLALRLRPVQGEYFSDYLVHTYGRQTETVLDLLDHTEGEDFSIRLAVAELRFCLEHEMVLSALDFFNRRTAMLFFDMPRLQHVKNDILRELKIQLGWSDERLFQEQEKLEQAIREARIYP